MADLNKYRELRDYYFDHNLINANLQTAEHQQFVKEVKEAASFINNMKGKRKKLSVYIHAILNDIIEPPICIVCGENEVGAHGKVFPLTCSSKCAAQHRKDVHREKYGVDNPLQREDIKQKAQATCMERYGHHSSLGSKQVQAKVKKTNLERYGTESPFHSKEIIDSIKQTNLERYGHENPFGSEVIKEQIKQTNLEKYGHENPFGSEDVKEKIKDHYVDLHGVDHPSKVPSIREKATQTNLERHGVRNPAQSEEFKSKAKKTCTERYGVDHPWKSPEVRQKALDTWKARYGREWPNQQHYSDEMIAKLTNKTFMQQSYDELGAYRLADALGVTSRTVYNYMEEHGIEVHPEGKSSYGERELRSFIESLGVEHIENDRSILGGRELDIFIPSHNVAIEYNGVYWHSATHKPKSYHQNKSIDCMNKGIQLIHVWEDDWNSPFKQEIIKDKIKAKLGMGDHRVYARTTKVVYPSTSQVRELYNSNHIQGFIRSTVHVGLEHEGTLIACASFHDMKDGVWDLTRFASSSSVVGGMSKLLKHFKDSYDWNMIYTYAHLDYSHGDVYEKIGFTKQHITSPGLWYQKNGVRLARQQFMKHKLESKLDNFDASLTERENMERNGFEQLFDSGSIRYELHKEK